MPGARFLAALLLVGASFQAVHAVKLNVTDCKNLVAGVQSWFPWLKCSSPPTCDLALSRRGINCNGRGQIVNIDLYARFLSGSLPASWGKLGGLKYIDVSRNLLTGTIPDAAWSGLATYLEDFTVSFNFLEGTLPSWLPNAKKLVYLDVGNNLLTGNPSARLVEMTSLIELSLNDNSFSGPLQPRWAQFPKLKTLTLGRNAMAGTVPATWANWKSQLRTLVLNRNYLTGPLPTFFSKYTLLSELDVGGNRFTGGLPSAWGSLKVLSSLGLRDLPNVRGAPPSSWKGMRSLGFMTIENTKIGGSVFAAFSSHPRNLVIATSSLTQICGVKPKNVRVVWQGAKNVNPLPTCPKGK